MIQNVRMWDITGLTEPQILAILAAPESATPALWLKGDGVTDANWIDYGSEAVHHGTVYGSPDPAYIRGDGKVIVNGTVMNP